jgi:hypothetical protein
MGLISGCVPGTAADPHIAPKFEFRTLSAVHTGPEHLLVSSSQRPQDLTLRQSFGCERISAQQQGESCHRVASNVQCFNRASGRGLYAQQQGSKPDGPAVGSGEKKFLLR